MPKRDLIAGVQVLLERGELRIARRLREAGTLARELTGMRMMHSIPGAGSAAGIDRHLSCRQRWPESYEKTRIGRGERRDLEKGKYEFSGGLGAGRYTAMEIP